MLEIVLKDTLWQVCTALQLVCELALTERVDPDPSIHKLRRHVRARYGTTIEILFLARQHKLMRLFDQRYVPAEPDRAPHWGWWIRRKRRVRVGTGVIHSAIG